MTYTELENLIKNDENRQLELKKSTGELKDAMHSACAFLNTDGGWLIFGVLPASLKIVGQQVTDNTRREISQALSLLEPQLDIKVIYIPIPTNPTNEVIAMHFDGWQIGKPPYTYHGCPYYRVESTTRVMPRSLYDERLKSARPNQFSWETQVADSVNISDLDNDLILGAIKLGINGGRLLESSLIEPIDKILAKLRLLENGKPNNAAVMLFGKNLYSYPQFKIRMARFKGTTKTAFIDNQQAEGNFFRLLDASMQFFFKHLSIGGDIKGIRRSEELEIPVVALREAIINALCHRQYEKYNLTIGISIFDDRVEIENPGIFPPPITPENIKEPHISQPFNPIIADVLFKTTYLENWGSGIGRILESCHDNKVKEPIWQCNHGFVSVIFERTRKHSDSTDRILNQIEQLISENPEIIISKIAATLGISERTVSRYISLAPHIRHIGPKKGGAWVILS